MAMCKTVSFTWASSLRSNWLSALIYREEPGPTMSHHFSSVKSHPPILFSICSGVNRNNSRQNILRFNFCAAVRMSVYHGFVHRKHRSCAMRWIVCFETSWPCRKSARLTFGAVALGSLNNSSTNVTISGFLRFGLTRFSPRQSRNASKCGVSWATLWRFMAR